MSAIGSRHEARERALGLLYEASAKQEEPETVMAALPVKPDEYAARLVTGVAAARPEIDAHIERCARGWTIERMPAIDTTVLRIAIYELLHCPDVPTAVVIDEAVRLADEFSTDDSGRFVNGMLGRLATELRPDDAAPAP